jgi:hypothetical protein
MLADELVLAAYAVGNDLEGVAHLLREQFKQYVAEPHWPSGATVFVDQVHDPDPAFPDWPADWDLGVNVGLDHLPRSPDWFAGVESLVGMLRRLAADTGREFVLFLCFRSEPWRQEDLVSVGPGPVDLAWLKEAIERRTSRRT